LNMGLFGTGITVDLRQFNQALREYAAESRRDHAYILNKQMGNVAARASGFAPTGNRADIQNLASRKWWWAFVRKKMNVSGGAAVKYTRKARGAEITSSYVDLATGKMIQGRKRVTLHRMVQSVGARKADLKRISKMIVKRRLATWKAMRAAFGVAALKFGVPLGRFERPHRLFALPHEIASENRARSSFTLPFKNKKAAWPSSGFGRRLSPREDVAAKKRIGNAALQQAVNFVARDMKQWAQERIAKTAAKFSARRAA
jgi:hypothetical protein